MFKILVVAYYFPPLGLSGVQRTLKFVKYLKDFNWQATVITTGNIRYYAYDDHLLKEAENSGARIIRTEAINPNSILKKKGLVKMPSTRLMKILGRISKSLFIPDNKIFWSRKAAKIAEDLLQKETFDAIFVTMPPFSTSTPFTKIKEKYDIPFFLDYRDGWLENQFRFYPSPYHRYKHKKLEDIALRKVDRVIVVNRIIKEQLLKNYQFLDFKDVEIIPHGYDRADFDECKAIPKENSKMIITYSGIFYEDITPKYLLKALKKIAVESPEIASNIKLKFVGHFKRENINLVKKLKLERYVDEIGYLDHCEVVKQINSSDILWLMLPNKRKMSNVTPGKLFEYFGTRKPIIASLPEGISKQVAEKYEAAFVTAPDDIEEISETILKVHSLYISGNLPKCNEDFVLDLDRKGQTEELAKIFQFYLKTE